MFDVRCWMFEVPFPFRSTLPPNPVNRPQYALNLFL